MLDCNYWCCSVMTWAVKLYHVWYYKKIRLVIIICDYCFEVIQVKFTGVSRGVTILDFHRNYLNQINEWYLKYCKIYRHKKITLSLLFLGFSSVQISDAIPRISWIHSPSLGVTAPRVTITTQCLVFIGFLIFIFPDVAITQYCYINPYSQGCT